VQQTPVHDRHNPDLLRFIPNNANQIIEIGCSSGALAREFKKSRSSCNWLGVDIDASYAELSKRHCDVALAMDIEAVDDSFFDSQKNRDCWIFGDTLEHLKDPWKVLRRIRSVIPPKETLNK
jgi:2-polyprenyl-3-methyl-5-hydroxy-6-metoxy-1,4-benzoquinol methylase